MATNRYIITRNDLNTDPIVIESEGLTIGRLTGNDLVLNHPTVSRTQAGIKKVNEIFYIFNLSSNGTLLNGSLVETTPIADGDLIQIGPFLLRPTYKDGGLALEVEMSIKPLPIVPNAAEAAGEGEEGKTVKLNPALLAMLEEQKRKSGTRRLPGTGALTGMLPSDVDEAALKVFRDKRKREAGKLAEASPLKPKSGKRVGKAQFNWRPTRDLQRPWPTGLFFWSGGIVLIVAVVSVFAFRDAYSPGALSSVHARKAMSITPAIAKQANSDSCSTCHSVTSSISTNCASCHSTQAFHSAVSAKHMAAGITCTQCHDEHRGRNFSVSAVANDRCTSCHRDGVVSNGKTLRTPHGGVLGYPVVDGKWQWTSLMQDQWQAKELPGSASSFGGKDQLNLIHVAGKERGRAKCSDCHTGGFEGDSVRVGVRESCITCHTVNYRVASANGAVAGCVGCHAQHGEEKELRASLRKEMPLVTQSTDSEKTK